MTTDGKFIYVLSNNEIFTYDINDKHIKKWDIVCSYYYRIIADKEIYISNTEFIYVYSSDGKLIRTINNHDPVSNFDIDGNYIYNKLGNR
jgi:hypothetical protein